jgi:hypothetical protein
MFEFEPGTFRLFYFYSCSLENRVCLSHGMQVTGAAWRTTKMIVAGVGDLVQMSYSVFMPKPSTHHMYDLGSIVPHIWSKAFTDNQMSRIKYNYYINNVSKDYNDS